MGRKGGGGGTAGGGRSGKKGNVTYTRVVPRFLQGLVDDPAVNPVDVKRAPSANMEQEDQGELKPLPDAKVASMEQQLAELKRDGFNVDVDATAARDASDVDAASLEPTIGMDDKGTGKEEKALSHPLPVSSGIEKKIHRASRPTLKFKVKDRKKLSFGAESSDSEGSE